MRVCEKKAANRPVAAEKRFFIYVCANTFVNEGKTSNMTNFIPIFPLQLVVYPGEALHLHIFEPRYKQLINECYADNKPFGIPVVIGKNVKELGTLVEITEIVRVEENGEMDIKTRGLKVFRVLETMPQVSDKLYSGAIVHYPERNDQGDPERMQRLLKKIRQLHRLLKVEKAFGKPDAELLSYDVAHHVGLSPEEEYELLRLDQELHRQEFLRRHLGRVVPIVQEMENLKERVKLNGHFKNLSSFEFDF